MPGNLHLIGKDNQNNPPYPQKKNSQDFLPPPTLTLTAGMQDQWWGGRLTNAVLTHETQTLQKARNQTVFVLSHCASYISHNLKRKRQYGQVTLVFQLPPLTVHGPEGVRTVPEEVVTHFPTRICPPTHPQLKADSSHIK